MTNHSKVGALIQNLKLEININPQGLESTAGAVPGRIATALNGGYSMNPTMVNVLPMLRLGGGYHISKNWLATASWMHAFGSTLKIDMPDMNFSSRTVGNLAAQIASPSLDAVLFGFEYRFVS